MRPAEDALLLKVWKAHEARASGLGYQHNSSTNNSGDGTDELAEALARTLMFAASASATPKPMVEPEGLRVTKEQKMDEFGTVQSLDVSTCGVMLILQSLYPSGLCGAG